MVSRSHKRTAMCRNLQLLRSITDSHARRKTSVLLDASEYIQALKRKLEELNQAITAQKSIDYDPMPMLRVEAQEKGFLIKVLSQRSCDGLLVFILEAFEELGLDVLQARVSCVDKFCLEAIGTKENNQETGNMDVPMVEKVVLQAIQNWSKVTEQGSFTEQ
ncbi:hypothetical protein L6164_024032 [Bauhinia variegata]|uniref:Uncharacterized protein n=1 Tax=Bauhinia variegata TaxID=167791 RepID=A0ACB9LWJ5_BAUVA|nr:hypothetical protein L6164_024032 [Bauhinia variegata]